MKAANWFELPFRENFSLLAVRTQVRLLGQLCKTVTRTRFVTCVTRWSILISSSPSSLAVLVNSWGCRSRMRSPRSLVMAKVVIASISWETVVSFTKFFHIETTQIPVKFSIPQVLGRQVCSHFCNFYSLSVSLGLEEYHRCCIGSHTGSSIALVG